MPDGCVDLRLTIGSSEATIAAVREALKSMVEGGTFMERPEEFANLAVAHLDLDEAMASEEASR